METTDSLDNKISIYDPYLSRSTIFDYDSEVFVDYFNKHIRDNDCTPLEQLVNFYYIVRDRINYQIFDVDVSSSGLKASSVITSNKGFCLHKSIVFITVARKLEFPARLKAVHVRNHLASPDIIRLMEGEVFLHWYAEVKINDIWIKATPVFSKLFCQLYGAPPLEFDGRSDSIHQPYNKDKSSSLIFLEQPVTVEPESAEELINKVKTSHPNFLNEYNIVRSNHPMSKSEMQT